MSEKTVTQRRSDLAFWLGLASGIGALLLSLGLIVDFLL